MITSAIRTTGARPTHVTQLTALAGECHWRAHEEGARARRTAVVARLAATIAEVGGLANAVYPPAPLRSVRTATTSAATAPLDRSSSSGFG